MEDILSDEPYDSQLATKADLANALDAAERRGIWKGVIVTIAIYFALGVAHFLGAHGL